MNVANLVKERCIVGDTVRFLKPFVGDSGKKVAQIVTDGKKLARSFSIFVGSSR